MIAPGEASAEPGVMTRTPNQACAAGDRDQPMSYTNLICHIVYATKERAPLITNTLRPRLHEYLGGTVRGLGGIAIEIRKSIIELSRSRKNLKLCCKHITLISTQLIYGDDSVASFAGSVGFSDGVPRLGWASPGATF